MVIQEVAYLRRHARALLGSQAVADRLVEASLRRVVAEERKKPRGEDRRVWLFRILYDECAQLNRAFEELNSVPFSPFKKAFHGLSDEHRAVLLLTSMDDFTHEDVASILAIEVEDVRSRLVIAREALDTALKTGDDRAPSSESEHREKSAND